MRTLEAILAIILLIRIVLLLFCKVRWIGWISTAALVVMVFHLIVEGFRWQMIPLYVVAVVLGVFSLWRLLSFERKNQSGSQEVNLSPKNLALSTLGIVILVAALILPILLPVPRSPDPTGPYEVGTMTITLVDKTREEIYSGKPGEPRTINVQIWYPAESEPGAKPAPWLDHMEVMGPILAAKLGLHSFFLDHVKYSMAYAVEDAAISNAESRYPLLLFSHGWGGFKAQNTYQVEELASHGYVVAAPDHTYGAIATILPGGRVALNNPYALPFGMDLSDDEFLKAAHILGDQWASDLSYILDRLEKTDPNDPTSKIAKRLDFTRVGVLGHSTGGGAGIQFCASDERCQAALGMDPYMDPVSPKIQNQGLEKPYLVMFSEAWAKDNGRNNDTFDTFFTNTNGDRYRYYIQETKHYDFTDMPAFSPLAPYLGLRGTLKAKQVSKIINAYTLAFFGRYFMDQSGLLLDQPTAEYHEMIYLP